MDQFSEVEFTKLSTQRQHIVEVLAICMTPVDVSILLQILRGRGWANAATKSGTLTQALARLELNALCKLGWISGSNSSMSFVVAQSQLLDAVVQFSVQNSNFKKIALWVSELEPQLDRSARDRDPGNYVGLIAKLQNDKLESRFMMEMQLHSKQPMLFCRSRDSSRFIWIYLIHLTRRSSRKHRGSFKPTS